MYEIFISHEAEKCYKKQDNNTKQKINKCLHTIAVNPLSSPHIKKLHGELEGNFRYAIGSLRIVYALGIENKVVKIKAIKSRGDAYK